MVRRFFSFLSKHVAGLHEAAFLLAIFSITSQLLGLLRDHLLANAFGAGTQLDVYYASFRVPDFIFASIASLVSMFIIIPFLSERIERGTQQARAFMESIVGAFTIMMVAVSVVAFILMPWLVKELFPVLATTHAADLISLSRILLLSPMILGLSNLLASIIQVERRFLIYALAPSMYNIGIILGILVLFPVFGLQGVAWGVAIGAFLHLAIQLPALLKSPFFPRFLPRILWRDAWEVTRVSLPRTFGLAMGEIVELLLVIMAGRMSAGSVAVFNLAFNLQSAPLAIIGVSYSVAAFPTLARHFSRGEHKDFVLQIADTARHILFWSFPALILFVVLRAQIVRTVLGSGAFSWEDTRLTAAVVALFVISLAAQSLVMLFVRGYYAAGRTWKPLLVNAGAGVLTIGLAFYLKHLFIISPMFRYFLEALFRVQDIPGAEVLTLAAAYSCGFVLNAIFLWALFDRDFHADPLRASALTLWQSFSASVLAGALAYVLLVIGSMIFPLQYAWGIFIQGAFAGIGGIVGAVIILYVLRNEELRDIVASLHHRFWKTQPLIPEQQEL